MGFVITILGANAAQPTGYTHSSAQALQAGSNLYLIDCAEGTQMQLRRYRLPLGRLKAVFISHLHGDHVFGLPGLLSSLSMQGRTAALDIYAPQPIEEWLNSHFRFFVPPSFPVHYHLLEGREPKVVADNKQFSVTAFPMKHRIEAWGFMFRESPKLLNIRKEMIPFYDIPLRDIPAIKAGADFVTADGRTVPNAMLTVAPAPPASYAYCSDTVWCPSIAEAVRGVSLLYHEATFAECDRVRATETFHSTAGDAARIAKAAEAHRLLIGHFSSRYDDPAILLNEARAVFPATEQAEEGRRYECAVSV